MYLLRVWRPLPASIVMFALVFYFFWIDEYDRYRKNLPIEDAPAYTFARLDGVTKIDSAGSHHVSVLLKYRFAVDGHEYHGSTAAMDREQALDFLRKGPIEVAYSTHDPSHNTVRSYFRAGQTAREFSQSFIVCGLLGLAVAIPFGLLVLLVHKLLRRLGLMAEEK